MRGGRCERVNIEGKYIRVEPLMGGHAHLPRRDRRGLFPAGCSLAHPATDPPDAGKTIQDKVHKARYTRHSKTRHRDKG